MPDFKVDPEFSKRIEVAPSYIFLRNRTGRSVRNEKLANTLKAMEVGKCVVYSSEEFHKEFGKHGIASIVATLKKRGVHKPGCFEENGKVYIFSRKGQ